MKKTLESEKCEKELTDTQILLLHADNQSRGT